VQRVPSLLLFNPTQSLSALNLEQYFVVDCEPLHDLKGHFRNLFEEIPATLPDQLCASATNLIQATLSKDKTTGADLRRTLINLYLLLTNHGASASTVLLLKTAVNMSEVMYLSEEHRTPRRILQLSNNSWLHHELCNSASQFQRSSPDWQCLEAIFTACLHTLLSNTN